MGKIYQGKFVQEIREPDLAANLSAKLKIGQLSSRHMVACASRG